VGKRGVFLSAETIPFLKKEIRVQDAGEWAVRKRWFQALCNQAGTESQIMRPANMNQTVFLSRHCYHPTEYRFFYLRFDGKKSGGVR
jgi:hypothetical protein